MKTLVFSILAANAELLFVTNMSPASKCKCAWYHAKKENKPLNVPNGKICQLVDEPSNKLIIQYLQELKPECEKKEESADGSLRQLPQSFVDQLTQKDPLSTDPQVLSGYGCYCRVDGFWKPGSGTPTDYLDEACHKVYQSYKCLTKVDSPTCDVENQVYVTMNVPSKMNSDVNWITNCQILQNLIKDNYENFDLECATRKCAIEQNFIAQMVEFAGTPGLMVSDDLIHTAQLVFLVESLILVFKLLENFHCYFLKNYTLHWK